jgi:mannose-1-phosphate guanylyltransferase
MQALILVGGEGTRLRPLTSTMPKPVVPLVDRPFIVYQLQWLRSHGVDKVVLACGFLPDAMNAVLGDGSDLGLELTYLVEPQPLGTGGALKFAEDLLADRFLMLNGDTLTDIDLTAQIAQHVATGAQATLALVPAEDPSAYGLVPLNPDDSVREFLEKPGPDEQLDTNLINAGAYVIEKAILADLAPAGTNVSIERDIFPKLVGHGLYGYKADGYWLDIGTPERYLQGTYDILERTVTTEVGAAITAADGKFVTDSIVSGRVVAPSVVGAGCEIATGAIVGGRAVLGENVRIGEGAVIRNSVLLENVSIGAHSTVTGSVLATGVSIGEHCHIEGGVVLGAGVRVGDHNHIAARARIFPGVQLPEKAIQF